MTELLARLRVSAERLSARRMGQLSATANYGNAGRGHCDSCLQLAVDACLEAATLIEQQAATISRLEAMSEGMREALEWALDNAGTEHPHYPERADSGGWHYPYLVNGSPMGGGVGHANFPTAVEAVLNAAALTKAP